MNQRPYGNISTKIMLHWLMLYVYMRVPKEELTVNLSISESYFEHVRTMLSSKMHLFQNIYLYYTYKFIQNIIKLRPAIN